MKLEREFDKKDFEEWLDDRSFGRNSEFFLCPEFIVYVRKPFHEKSKTLTLATVNRRKLCSVDYDPNYVSTGNFRRLLTFLKKAADDRNLNLEIEQVLNPWLGDKLKSYGFRHKALNGNPFVDDPFNFILPAGVPMFLITRKGLKK